MHRKEKIMKINQKIVSAQAKNVARMIELEKPLNTRGQNILVSTSFRIMSCRGKNPDSIKYHAKGLPKNEDLAEAVRSLLLQSRGSKFYVGSTFRKHRKIKTEVHLPATLKIEISGATLYIEFRYKK